MADVKNKIDVRGDGAVVLYQRANRDRSVNQIFQMRIRIPLSASKGYFRGSTGESNQGRATQVALNKFDELYNMVKGGGTLLGKSFKDLFNEWKVHYPKVSNESLPHPRGSLPDLPYEKLDHHHLPDDCSPSWKCGLHNHHFWDD